MLRFRTYLTPSIPERLFQVVADYVGKVLTVETRLDIESAHSGPPRDHVDPFSRSEIDVAFLCSPPYIWLSAKEPSPIHLVPVAPVHNDARNAGLPVYFSDVIVHADSSVYNFSDLRGTTWSYNDPESLSGYYCTVQKLESMGETAAFFGRVVDGGCHLGSLRLVLAGEVAASAIDSIALALYLQRHPTVGQLLRVIDVWGPSPVQPIVARRSLSAQLKQELTAALADMHRLEPWNEQLADFGITHFGQISDADYDVERLLLAQCDGLRLSV